ncbi:MAG: GAF domain-containing protein [bacterium]
MKTWEVIIPPAGGGTLQTLIIEAQTWMLALSEGLRQLSDPAHLSSLACNILHPGSLEIVDSKSGRTITIRELSPEALEAQLTARAAAQQSPYAPVTPDPAAPPVDAPPSVPPPDPTVAGDKTGATAVGLPALGGQAASPTDGKIRRRQTRELTATASAIVGSDHAGYAAPPSATPPQAPPPTLEAPSKLTEESVRSSGEFVGITTGSRRKITEPAIIIDDVLQAEIEQLETLRKAREAAMTPPAMRPIPHKVFKVIAEAPEGPRNETVRRRYVSVWPNPPREALEEVLQIQFSQVLSELEATASARRILIAAFDHAFERIPLRPPLGICTWATSNEQIPPASFVYDDAAAALWSPPSPSTGSGKSPMMVPALDPSTAAAPGVGALPRSQADTEVVTPLAPPVAPAPPAASPPPAAAPPPTAPPPTSPPPAAHYTEAPAPVHYPAELQHSVYESHFPAPTPEPPSGTLDPFYRQEPAGAPVAPVAPVAPAALETAPGNLLNAAFGRLQALFYVTDRQQAFAYCIDTALYLVPSAAGVILLYDYSARDLFSTVIRGPGGHQPAPYRVAVADGLAGFCATQGLPLSLTHVDQDMRLQSALSQLLGLPGESIAGVPIQYQGRLYGVLELLNRQAGGGYTTEEVNALAYIGRQLAERLSTTLSQPLPIVHPDGTPATH